MNTGQNIYCGSDSEREGKVNEREDDIILTEPRQKSPSGISAPVTDVRHLSGIKHNQQADFQTWSSWKSIKITSKPCLCAWVSPLQLDASPIKMVSIQNPFRTINVKIMMFFSFIFHV